MTIMKTATPTIVVFDLGGVLIEWNPDYLFRKLIANETERKWFLANVYNSEWYLQQNGGRPFNEAILTISTKNPEHAHLIATFHACRTEMIVGTLAEGIAIFEALESTSMPLFALNNWSAETSPYAWRNYLLLHHVKDVLVSGREKLIEPNTCICARMLERIRLHYSDAEPGQLVFIDNVRRNADVAQEFGWHATHHTTPADTTAQLRSWGLLP